MGLPDWAQSFCEIGVDLLRNHVKGKIDEKILNNNLQIYLSSELEKHKGGLLREEYDVTGILSYIKESLFQDFSRAIFAQSSIERRNAREVIISKAREYAKASNLEASDKIKGIIGNILGIYHDFYKKKNELASVILVNDAVDDVCETISNAEENITDTLKHVKEEVLGEMFYSPESLGEMARRGDYSKLTNSLLDIKNAIDAQHPLKPYYGTNLHGSFLVSQPLIPEAIEKYPPKFVCTGHITVNGEDIDADFDEIEDYAYRHQKTIEFSIESAQKKLGNIKDPYQTEAEKLIGAVLIKHPDPFPPAFACKITINDEIFYDHLMLRTQKIDDDGSIILSNKEQKQKYLVEVILDYKRNSIKLSSMIIADASNLERVRVLKFIQKALAGGTLSINSYDKDLVLAEGIIPPHDIGVSASELEEEIDFFERLCIIENYCKLKINSPKTISQGDYNRVVYWSDIIGGKEKEESWKELELEGTVDDELRQMVSTAEANELALWISMNCKVNLWDLNFSIPIARLYRTVSMENIEKMQKMMECLSNGDPIRFNCVPGKNKIVLTKLDSGEECSN